MTTYINGIEVLQTVTVGTLKPASDSTTAVQITKADGSTPVVTVDTTNRRIGIGTVVPKNKLDVNGNIRSFGGDIPSSGHGVEIMYSGGIGYVSSIDRDASSYTPLQLRGDDLIFKEGNTEIMRIANGNVGIGTTDQFGSGVGVLALGNAITNPTTTLTNAALLYASGGELYAYDAAGNSTLLSPHATTWPQALAVSPEYPAVSVEDNLVIGIRRYIAKGRAFELLEELARAAGLLADGEHIVIYEDIEPTIDPDEAEQERREALKRQWKERNKRRQPVEAETEGAIYDEERDEWYIEVEPDDEDAEAAIGPDEHKLPDWVKAKRAKKDKKRKKK